ncbi:MAG: DnaJ domain-containing protein [Coriobacteriales bacterium]|nr:DnaJ domain-containing protein [Coriobacteriales bacterium]
MDHYRTLQVSRDAEPEVIERAYKALARKYHPDRVTERQRPDATRRMQRINEAYRVLRDPASRKRYDALLPPEGAHAWDIFWERGLVGMFRDRYPRR